MRCPTSMRTLRTVQAGAAVNRARRHPLEKLKALSTWRSKSAPAIRGNHTAIETSHNFVTVEAFKSELRGDTVRLHRTPSYNLITFCCKSSS